VRKLEQVPKRTTNRAEPPGSPKFESGGSSNKIQPRPTAANIYTSVEEIARVELERSPRSLAFSGLAGGLGMGLTGIGVASVRALLGDTPQAEFIALLFYPIGFIAVVIGRAQLFTENTLYPVALVLSERQHVLKTLRLWLVVFISNIVGSTVFAALAVMTGALHPNVLRELVALGSAAVAGGSAHVFWSGVVGGWIIALMAWIVSGSSGTISQVIVIRALTVVVGMGHFAHCIASSGEIVSAVLSGFVKPSAYVTWEVSVALGNIVGGVFFVTLLNFGQVTDSNMQDR